MPEKSRSFAWAAPLRPILARSNLLIGAAFAVGLYFAAGLLDMKPLPRGLLAWDCGVVVVLTLILRSMTGVDLARMKLRAAAQDQGRRATLLLTMVAALASIAAIAGELVTAKDLSGAQQAFQVGLAFATIVLSWAFVQLIFAVHYAHAYYRGGEKKGQSAGGLAFPQDEQPDYWDFVHFAVILGAAAQTADVAITSRPMRHLATVHTLIAFTFNTAILAVMINVVASLLQ